MENTAIFRFNEGEIKIPDGWEDKSVTALSFPAGSQKPEASLAITRDNSIKPGQSLPAYVDKQMVDLAKTCPRFELISREQLDLNGLPSHKIQFTWRSPDGSIVQQQQTIVILRTGVVLTITATTQQARFSDYASVFNDIIQSLTFQDARSQK